jgi:hypothetical protein
MTHSNAEDSDTNTAYMNSKSDQKKMLESTLKILLTGAILALRLKMYLGVFWAPLLP